MNAESGQQKPRRKEISIGSNPELQAQQRDCPAPSYKSEQAISEKPGTSQAAHSNQLGVLARIQQERLNNIKHQQQPLQQQPDTRAEL